MSIKVGDKIPDFILKDAKGNDFDSRSIIGTKAVVLYFYPRDNTPGCTTQACGFRDLYEDFIDLGSEVIGVSSDSVTMHQEFTKQYKLPFILLSDQDKELQKLFGVPTNLFGLLPGRVTYIIDRNGIVVMIFNSMIASKHLPRALEAIKKLT